MSNRLHQLILALAATGMTAAAWAQSAPDTAPGGDGPGGPGGPPHTWHDGDGGEHGARKHWDGDERRDGERGHGRHHYCHRGGMPGRAGLALAFHDLNLTPEQRQKMRTIVMTARLQMMQQAGAHKPEGPGDMAALINPGDPNYNAAVQAAKQRAADRIKHMSDLKLQLYNVLTPEQKSELTRRVSAWRAGMAQGPKGPPAPAAR